ncbi:MULTISPECIES: hypothetical protein [Bacillus]|uniref:Lipoprotein n=1 Tax=Bacillus mycoides TaxID=1405 RepID=A0A1E8B5A5_BACMY|nr:MULTISPECIES: hypothetical protein [Bacillus cereus group]OFD77083.1 hypothetical protein BWGOE9_33220 [Bacillus mycoides]OFD77088.1 hypothetical protein BWGOE8_32970 [Bacillus mycoides]OFD78109.1 hypothetical protein BWGOE10_33540 [Bacillus mycoides]
MKNVKFYGLILAFILLLAACSSNSFEDYTSKADKKIKDKKYSEAIKNYQEALKLKDDKKIKSKLEQTGNLKKAQDAFDKHEIGKAMNNVQKAKSDENKELTKQANALQGEIQQEFLATFNKLNMNNITGDVTEARKSLDDLMAWIQQSDLLKSQKDFVDTLPEKEASISKLEESKK